MTAEQLSRIAADFETSLSTAVSVADTSFTLQSVTDDDGVLLSDGIYCFTLDRDSSSSKEYMVGQLTASTKTVSSISSVSRQGVLTANFQKAHRIGTNVIISDHSVLNAIVKILNGTGTLNPASPIAYDSTATISGVNMLATKAYVDSVVNGGTIEYDNQILSAQTAGETLALGELIYLKESDSRWWLVDTDTATTYDKVKLGIAMGAGTAGNTISGGVQVSGLCSIFTGLSANDMYYASATGGALTTTATTPKISVGVAISTTTIILDFNGEGRPTGAEKDALAGGTAGGVAYGTPSTTNKFVTEEGFDAEILAGTIPTVQTFSGNGTYTPAANVKYVIVKAVGGGGGSRGASSGTSGGGGSGGYGEWVIPIADIGASQAVTIGAAGAAGAAGNGGTGGTTSLGTLATAAGGVGTSGNSGGAVGAVGGTATLLLSGGVAGGTSIYDYGPTPDFSNSGAGGSNIFGQGGQARVSSISGASAVMIGEAGRGYGAGGSGSIGTNTGAAGTIGYMAITEYYS